VVTHARTRVSGESHVHRACQPMWPLSSEDTGARAVGYIRRVEGGSSIGACVATRPQGRGEPHVDCVRSLGPGLEHWYPGIGGACRK